MTDEEYLKMRGFHFQKLMEDNDKHADECAKYYVQENCVAGKIKVENLKKAFADGFRECTRQMKNTFEDCSPQKEINIKIDELIDKIRDTVKVDELIGKLQRMKK